MFNPFVTSCQIIPNCSVWPLSSRQDFTIWKEKNIMHGHKEHKQHKFWQNEMNRQELQTQKFLRCEPNIKYQSIEAKKENKKSFAASCLSSAVQASQAHLQYFTLTVNACSDEGNTVWVWHHVSNHCNLTETIGTVLKRCRVQKLRSTSQTTDTWKQTAAQVACFHQLLNLNRSKRHITIWHQTKSWIECDA